MKRRLATHRLTTLGAVALVGYIAVIVLANWALHHLGTPPPPHVPAPHTLPVWPGLDAPSGVWFVALALVLRNVVQRHLGRIAAIVAIAVGAAISWYIADPTLAKASFWAFLCSEALDMSIYTPLRSWLDDRGVTPLQIAGAVLPAALAGAALDSWLFLRLAFHSESFWKAQMVGKTWGVLAATLILISIPVVTARLPRTAEIVPA